MAAIRIRTKLESDTLTLPELRPLIGKTVEIRVVEKPGNTKRPKVRKSRPEYDAEGPVPTLEEVRAALSSIKGSVAAQIIADRG